MSGALAMGNNKITGLGTPTANTDATTKTYVDGILGSATVAATSATNAATSETNAASSATAASNSATSAATSATNAASSYDNFDDRYLGAKSSAPTVDNDGDALITGALYFNSTTNIMNVYGSGGWQSAGSAVNGTSERNTYTATAGQTVFAATYDTGYIDVYLNGVKLLVGTDFTATNGTSITLASGASVNDVVDIVAYGTFELADHYTKTASDARYVNVAGDTMTGNLSFGDNDKAIFGAGSDLQIYHDGANNYIEGSTGSVIIQNTLDNYNVIIKSDNGSGGLADYFRANGNTGAALMYHYGSEKLTTTSTGIDVTGKVTSTGLIGNNTNFDIIQNTSDGSDNKRTRIGGGGDVVSSRGAMIEMSGNEHGNGGMLLLKSGHGGAYSQIRSYTSNTERMRIDASGRVGIGTSSPQAELHVHDPAGHAKIRLSGTASDADTFEIYQGITGVTNGGLTIRDVEASADRLVINSSGNVGIGTNSPASWAKLDILGTGGSQTGASQALQVRSPSATAGEGVGIRLNAASGSHEAVGIIGMVNNASGNAGSMTFHTYDGGATIPERMRIDNSGNLLVGTTNDLPAISNVQGIALSAGSYGGRLEASRSGGAPVCFNRLENGSIVEIKKAGVTSGIIGAVGTQSYIHGGGTDVGIYFGSNNLYPYRQAGLNDATIDLGQGSKRFKDAYLSGGVYLGGTGSANKLDDYEEGTHAATFAMNGSGSISMLRRNLAYIKVGRLVTITGEVSVSSVSSPVGSMTMTLPFTISATGSGRDTFFGAKPVAYRVPHNQDNTPAIIGNTTNAEVTFLYEQDNAPFASYTPAANATFNISFSYLTN